MFLAPEHLKQSLHPFLFPSCHGLYTLQLLISVACSLALSSLIW